MGYTTADNVSEYLQQTISSTTTPNTATVERWIEEESSQIEHITKLKFEATSVANLIIDTGSDSTSISSVGHDGVGVYNLPGVYDRIHTGYTGVLRLIKVEKNDAAPSDTPSYTELAIGLGGDVVLRDDYIEVISPDITIPRQRGALRVTLQYGTSDTDLMAQKLCTLMVADRVMSSATSKSVAEGGGSIRVGDIEIQESNSFTTDFIRSTKEEIRILTNLLGTQNYYSI